MSLIRREKGSHPALSEHWLLDNLPEGWSYDCQTSDEPGFIIKPPYVEPEYGYGNDEPEGLFIPLALLKRNRHNKEIRKGSIEDARSSARTYRQ